MLPHHVMSDDAKTASSEPSNPPRQKRLIELGVILAITLGLDLWSKAWAWENLREGQRVTVIEKWVEFEFGFNTGSAFSFLRDASYARITFIAVTILALLYMGRLAMTLPTRFRSAFIAIALVSGGALGNLHDRLIRMMELRGEMRYGVVDFIKVHYWEGKIWPTFNVADIALVVGVGLLFIFLTRHGDAIDREKKAAEGTGKSKSTASSKAKAKPKPKVEKSTPVEAKADASADKDDTPKSDASADKDDAPKSDASADKDDTPKADASADEDDAPKSDDGEAASSPA